MKYHVGASRIRMAVQTIEDVEEAVRFLRYIFPEMSERVARLVVRYPGETSVNGPYLKTRDSWEDVNVTGSPEAKRTPETRGRPRKQKEIPHGS